MPSRFAVLEALATRRGFFSREVESWTQPVLSRLVGVNGTGVSNTSTVRPVLVSERVGRGALSAQASLLISSSITPQPIGACGKGARAGGLISVSFQNSWGCVFFLPRERKDLYESRTCLMPNLSDRRYLSNLKPYVLGTDGGLRCLLDQPRLGNF